MTISTLNQLSLYQNGCKSIFDPPQDKLVVAFPAAYYEATSQQGSVGSALSGKVTSILVVVGLGGWLCYKLLNICNHTKKPRRHPKPPPSSTSSEASSAPSLSNRNYRGKSFQTSYFGPKHANPFDEKSGGSRRELLSDSDSSPYSLNRYKNRRPSKKLTKTWLSDPRFRCSINKLNQDDIYDSDSIISNSTSSMRRDESMDSMCSEFSFDLSAIVEDDSSNTVAKMDELFKEIDQLKSNCLSLDEEFETVRVNRNLPGLSNLMKLDEDKELESRAIARECFKDLYSLTTINRSMSFDMSSMESESPAHSNKSNRGGEDDGVSLEWDQDASLSSDHLSPVSSGVFSFRTSMIASSSESYSELSLSLTDQASLEDTIRNNNEDHYDSYAEEETGRDSQVNSKRRDSLNINKIRKNTIGVLVPINKYVELLSISLTEQSLKGYNELQIRGYKSIRLIQSDANSLIRAVLYHVLTQSLPLPSRHTTFQTIVDEINRNPTLLSSWEFGYKLPYSKNNLQKTIQVCLNTLENVSALLSTSEDRTESLRNLLNTDPTLDVHMIEAVKIHIVAHALNHQTTMTDYSVYSEDECNNTDEMNNYNNQTSGVDYKKMETSLLGQTLNLIIKIIQPSAACTSDFIRCYPSQPHNWPSVDIVMDGNTCNIVY